MIHQILTDIQDQLKAVKGLRYISEDWGQLELDNPPILFPCALVDVDGFNYSQTGNLEQIGEGYIHIRVAEQLLVKVSSTAPEKLTEASIEFFKIMDAVRNKLHGYSGGRYSKLIRTSFKRVRQNDSIREYIFTFKTSYEEVNEKKVVKIDNPKLEIKTGYPTLHP